MQLFWLTAALLAPLSRPGLPTAPRYPLASPAPIARLSPAALMRQVERVSSRPLAERIDHWSRLFKGTPYVPTPDSAPPPSGLDLYRVDCETYVEQVLALALSRRWPEVNRWLHRLRYRDGQVDSRHRHFTVVKGWLAGAERQGVLTDVTARIGGAHTRSAYQSLKPSVRWRPYYLRRIRALGALAPRGIAKIDYIPLRKAMGLVRRIPPGTVVHVVAAPHPRSPYLVTHVGFAARTRYGPVFRHASQSPARRKVEDRLFAAYLYYIGHTPSGPEMRTGIGIHLSAVRQPAPGKR